MVACDGTFVARLAGLTDSRPAGKPARSGVGLFSLTPDTRSHSANATASATPNRPTRLRRLPNLFLPTESAFGTLEFNASAPCCLTISPVSQRSRTTLSVCPASMEIWSVAL